MNVESKSGPIVSDACWNSWLYFNVLTDSSLILGKVQPQKRDRLVGDVYSGANPVEAVREASPIGSAPAVIPVNKLKRIEWVVRDIEPPSAYAVYESPSNALKEKRKLTIFRDGAARRSFIESAKSLVGQHEQIFVKNSIWYRSAGPITTLILGLLLCFLPLLGDIEPSKITRGRAIAQLLAFVGPVGTVATGCIMITSASAFWYYQYSKAPKKMAIKFRD